MLPTLELYNTLKVLHTPIAPRRGHFLYLLHSTQVREMEQFF